MRMQIVRNRIRLFTTGIFVGISLFAGSSVQAQFNQVYNLPPDPDFGDNVTINSDTQVNLFDGGLIGESFGAGVSAGTSTNIEVNVFGGEIGRSMNAYAGTTVNISGGFIGNSFQGFGGSITNITGGTVDRSFEVRNGGIANVSGGDIRIGFTAAYGGVANISGGSIGSIRAETGGIFNVTGGYLGSSSAAYSGGTTTMSGGNFGSRFRSYTGAAIEFRGGEFMLDGVGVSGAVNVLPGSVLTGTLEDGSVFIFSSQVADTIADGTLTLSSTSVPGGAGGTFDVPSGPAPNGLRSGQTLNLANGGILGDGFGAVSATFNMTGGTVGGSLETYDSSVDISGGTVGYGTTFFDSNVLISGGAVGDATRIYGTSVVDVTGGELGFATNVYSGAVINVSGGRLGNVLGVYTGGIANISGGRIGDDGGRSLRARSGSTLALTGGNLRGVVDLDSGSNTTIAGGVFGELDADSGSVLEIQGGNFQLNGGAVSGAVDLTSGSLLSGVLKDGSVFILFESGFIYDTIDAGVMNLVTTSVAPVGPPVQDISVFSDVNSIRAGQTLNLLNGGELDNNFAALNATLNIQGGTLGRRLEVVDSVVNMEAGTVGGELSVFDGSVFNLSGGSLSPLVSVHDGATFHVFGTMFALDGVDISNTLTPGEAFLLVNRGAVLSGLLNDGTSFSFGLAGTPGYEHDYFSFNAQVFLTLAIPEPASGLVFLVSGCAMLAIRRKRSE